MPRIVIAGGGVAGLEACLALRSFLGEEQLAIDLLCPEPRFEYRPLAVLEPFDGAPAWSMELATFAADQGVRLVRGALRAIDPARSAGAPGARRAPPLRCAAAVRRRSPCPRRPRRHHLPGNP